jgi:hypothetical protein
LTIIIILIKKKAWQENKKKKERTEIQKKKKSHLKTQNAQWGSLLQNVSAVHIVLAY